MTRGEEILQEMAKLRGQLEKFFELADDLVRVERDRLALRAGEGPYGQMIYTGKSDGTIVRP